MIPGHVIHIGFPKTGSNYLRAWFRRHPQLAYTEGGIAGVRDVYQLAKHAARRQSNLRYFVTSAEHLATPTSSAGDPPEQWRHDRWNNVLQAQDVMCALLAGLFPTARVVCVTRGFRSMIVSSYSQFVRSGGVATFEQFCDGIRTHPSGSVWDYSRVWEMYQAAFSPAHVLFLPYELLRAEPARFTATLETWLGLDHCDAADERHNRSVSPEALRWYPRLTRAVQSLPVGDPLKQGLVRWHIRRTMAGRYHTATRLLNRLFPTTPVALSLVPDDCMEIFRGKAEAFRDNPLYAPYAAEYLL